VKIGDLVTVKSWCERANETGVILNINEKTEDYQVLLPNGTFWFQKRDITVTK